MFKCALVEDFVPNDVADILMALFTRGYYHRSLDDEAHKTKKAEVNNENVFYSILHSAMTFRVSEIIGEEAVPTFMYARKYDAGMQLEKHIDRPACHFTASLTIQENDADWPLNIELEDEVTSLNAKKGALAIFRGSKYPHFREELKSGSQTQIFYCFVPNREEYKPYFYDGEGRLPVDVYEAGMLKHGEKPENTQELLNTCFEVIRAGYERIITGQ